MSLPGAVQNLDYTLLTGNGGNPNLKPIRSNNYDASLEWYFRRRSMVSLIEDPAAGASHPSAWAPFVVAGEGRL